jgi:hypothetical protein
VKVRHDEGIANPHRPQAVRRHPRGGRRSVGRGTCRPAIEPRNTISRTPTLLCERKAIWAGALVRVPDQSGAVVDPGMHGNSLYGNREISGLAMNLTEELVRSGKARSRSR